jgi:hypothetical protein
VASDSAVSQLGVSALPSSSHARSWWWTRSSVQREPVASGAATKKKPFSAFFLSFPHPPPHNPAQNLNEIDVQLAKFKASSNLELWMEPGRYIIAEAGILLARVTQLKEKEGVTYVGIDSGFNSLIRPMLYGSYHVDEKKKKKKPASPFFALFCFLKSN